MSNKDLHNNPQTDTISKGADKPANTNPSVSVVPPPSPSGNNSTGSSDKR